MPRLARLGPIRIALIGLLCVSGSLRSSDLPDGFVDEFLFSIGESPATLKFSPSGDLYVGLRIRGELYRVPFGDWNNPRLLYGFDIPKDGNGNPAGHRSSGLRDITFSADGRFVYAFFMRDTPRHNRVVRIEVDANDPDLIVPGSETLLLDLPFNGSASSGSHNGGALEFGGDGLLYISSGDGWNGGDPVQSLSTYTGKLLRIAADGSIPTDNPFYGQTSGALRATFALGCRNPFSMTVRAADGALFINETTGANKSDVFEVAAGANFGHQGYGGIGIDTPPWLNSSTGGHLNTGSAWYDGWRFAFSPPLVWPAQYHGGLFVCQWGTNGGQPGRIVFIPSGSTTPTGFATSIAATSGDGQVLKPVCLRMGPDGHLYYLLTTYDTTDGRIQRIRYTGQATAATPSIAPDGGTFPSPVVVSLSSTTPAADIHYTLDGSDPDAGDALYSTPLVVARSGTLKARAFATGLAPSGIASAEFGIGPIIIQNEAPVAIGGPRNVVWPIDRLHTLNGSASFDPDGSDELLSDVWTQTGGPALPAFDGNDFVSFFIPQQVGEYAFRLDVCDPSGGCDADEVMVTVVPCLDDLLDSLSNRWLLDESSGLIAYDSSKSAGHGTLVGDPSWSPISAYPESAGSLEFDGVDDAVSITSDLDPSANQLTLAAWFRADDFDVHDARIVSKATGSSDAEHWFMLSTLDTGGAKRLRFRLKAGGVTTTLIASSGDLLPGQWTHVAALYDGNAMKLYRNGLLVGSTPKTGLIDSAPGVTTAIGNQPATATGGARPFDGLIDDVRVYTRALEEMEIALLADSARIMTVPAECACQADIGYGSGPARLSLCGDLRSGGGATIRATGLSGPASHLLVASLSSQPITLPGGAILAAQPIATWVPIQPDQDGAVSLPVVGGGGPLMIYLQVLSRATGPTVFSVSNALLAELQP